MSFLSGNPSLSELLQQTPAPPSVNWPGLRQTYEFQLHPIWTQYHQVAGVYIFCNPINNNQWRACYVGETDDFQRRLYTELTGHHRWQSIVNQGATHICTLVVTGERAVRLQIETDLRQNLNPPCNLQ